MTSITRLITALILSIMLFQGAFAAEQLPPIDIQPPADPDDGVTFRVLAFHDVRDNLRASFETYPDATDWVNHPADEKIKISATVTLPGDYFLNWAEVAEMQRSGLVEFASHTHNLHHGMLANPQGNELPAATALRY